MPWVQFLLALCLSPASVWGIYSGQGPSRSAPGEGPSDRGAPTTSKKPMKGKPMGPINGLPMGSMGSMSIPMAQYGFSDMKAGGKKEETGSHILAKMTHLEKIFNFCDLESVKKAKESYKSDFIAFDKKSKKSCGRLRCMGSNHICCPVSGQFNGTDHTDYFCLSNTEEHRGSCPTDATHVTHMEYGTTKKLSQSRADIKCRRDAECRLDEKCCMKTEQTYAQMPWMDDFTGANTGGYYQQEGYPQQGRSGRSSIKCLPALSVDESPGDEFEMGLKSRRMGEIKSMIKDLWSEMINI